MNNTFKQTSNRYFEQRTHTFFCQVILQVTGRTVAAKKYFVPACRAQHPLEFSSVGLVRWSVASTAPRRVYRTKTNIQVASNLAGLSVPSLVRAAEPTPDLISANLLMWIFAAMIRRHMPRHTFAVETFSCGFARRL